MKITIDLPDYLVDKLREKAEAANLSFNDYIVRRLSEFAFFDLNAEIAKLKKKDIEGQEIEGEAEDASSVEAMPKSFGM